MISLRPAALVDSIWAPQRGALPRLLTRSAQVLWCTLRALGDGQLSLRAMSLVYTTLLSLVPLLALSFSMLKALGVHNRIEPALLQLFEPLGTEAERITALLIGFVDRVQIGVLGSLGIALLFYAVLSMIQKVESSFNAIWRVAQERPLAQRISEYLVVLMLGPLAVSLVLGVTAGLLNSRVVERLFDLEFLGTVLYLSGRMLPYLVMAGIFTFLFMFIPNTRVRLRAAAAGGVTAGILWQSANWGFASFVAAASNYNAIYSSFAIMIFLLIWLYLGWLILLIGCQISFFVQHPEYLSRTRDNMRASPAQWDAIALSLMAEVCAGFRRGETSTSAETLIGRLGVRPEVGNPVLDRMLATGMLVESAQGGLLPGRDPLRLSARELLEKLHGQAVGVPASAALRRLEERLKAARETALGQLSIAELVEEDATDVGFR